jgi:hypothetical protein
MGSPEWSCKELVCEQLPAPSTHRASFGAKIEHFDQLLFSGKAVSFQGGQM